MFASTDAKLLAKVSFWLDGINEWLHENAPVQRFKKQQEERLKPEVVDHRPPHHLVVPENAPVVPDRQGESGSAPEPRQRVYSAPSDSSSTGIRTGSPTKRDANPWRRAAPPPSRFQSHDVRDVAPDKPGARASRDLPPPEPPATPSNLPPPAPPDHA
jgi:hypothetical protein